MGVSIQAKHTSEDLLALGNILHGRAVDTTDLCNNYLMWTTWRVGDVALSGIFLWLGHS
jgi:hypothetical protein